MKRILLALLATQNLAYAGVIMVDDAATKEAPKGIAPTAPGPNASGPVSAAAPSFAAAPVAPSIPVVHLPQWEMKAGQSLRATLDSWCERAGYRLVWKVEGGFRLQGDFVSNNEFKQAVAELFAAIPQDLHLDVEITKNKLVMVSEGSK